MLTDWRAAWRAFVTTLAITTVWYALEFMEFGTLMWDRTCDDIIIIIFFFVLWHSYYRDDQWIRDIVKECRKEYSQGKEYKK